MEAVYPLWRERQIVHVTVLNSPAIWAAKIHSSRSDPVVDLNVNTDASDCTRTLVTVHRRW